jgi:DNA-binding PucR family transcriptional regulator
MSGGEDPSTTLLRILASGGTEAQLAEVDAPSELRSLAHQIRESFSANNRRERELEALFETARDLAALREPEEVLNTIVRQARKLLTADLAYITLFDREAGDTYVRATSGSLSPEFQSVRVPLGAGLGGLVASSQQTYWTPNYFVDERFKHMTSINSAVADEGIVAVCGTPLTVKDEFVGVLFAAERSERNFQHAEVALLMSFATLAAVSIAQAGVLRDTQAALAALSEAHETVRRRTQDVERAAAAHDRFLEALLAGGGLDDITLALGELLGGWVALVDADGRHRSSFGGPTGLDEGALSLVLDRDKSEQRLPGRLLSGGGVHSVALAAGRDPLGTLVVGGIPNPDPGDTRTIERAAVVSALVLLFEREVLESHRQAVADLVSDLIALRGDRADRIQALRAQDLSAQSLSIAVARPPRGIARRSLVMTLHTVLDRPALIAEHDGDVVVIVAEKDPSELADVMTRLLSSHGATTVAASGPFDDIDRVPTAYAEAQRTLAALIALGHEGTGAAASDLGFAGLVVGDEPDIRDYVCRAIGPLVEYDADHDTDLVATLEAYFASRSSPRRTGEILHVHRNTVVQRLERIDSLLTRDLRDADFALEAQLALRLRRLMMS